MRILRYCLIGLFIVLIACIVTIHIQQRILRARAERLLTEFQHIEVNKASFEDAQKFVARWQRWSSQKCSTEECYLGVTICDPIRVKILERRGYLPGISPLYVFMGGRPSVISVTLFARNGTVVGKNLWAAAEISPFHNTEDGYYVDAEVQTGPEPSGFAVVLKQLTLHSDYIVNMRGPSFTACSSINVHLVTSASPVDVHRLTQVDFGFLTRLVPIRDKRDIMPGACEQARKDRSILGDYPDVPRPPQ